ncbi:MAG: hypothetical protein KIT83_04590 [Bryobacterales bacterium]|nr:hypothetical protein [Bryobacterales bacterium]
MDAEQKLRERMRKIALLYEGAATEGERAAAAEAMLRLKRTLAELARTERPTEFQFTLSDEWHRRLFTALCRRYGIEPYRYKRQRYTTVMVRAPKSFVELTLWPEYAELRIALDEYLIEATDRIIREEVFSNAGAAREMAG